MIIDNEVQIIMQEVKKNIPIIAMDHITKQYSTGVDALVDISIRINKGESLSLLSVKVDRENPLLLNCC